MEKDIWNRCDFQEMFFENIPREAPEESESPAGLASESQISLIENMT
jgi:hypothetical protein